MLPPPFLNHLCQELFKLRRLASGRSPGVEIHSGVLHEEQVITFVHSR